MNVVKFSGPEQAWTWYCKVTLINTGKMQYSPSPDRADFSRPCSSTDLFNAMKSCLGVEGVHAKWQRRTMLTPRMKQILLMPIECGTLNFFMNKQEIAMFDYAMEIVGAEFFRRGFTERC